MRQTFVVRRVFAFFLYLCLLSQSDPQDFSIPKPYDKSSTRGREQRYLRPRAALPAAASSATGGREQIICMASRRNDESLRGSTLRIFGGCKVAYYISIDMSGEKGGHCGASIAPLFAAKHCSSLSAFLKFVNSFNSLLRRLRPKNNHRRSPATPLQKFV